MQILTLIRAVWSCPESSNCAISLFICFTCTSFLFLINFSRDPASLSDVLLNQIQINMRERVEKKKTKKFNTSTNPDLVAYNIKSIYQILCLVIYIYNIVFLFNPNIKLNVEIMNTNHLEGLKLRWSMSFELCKNLDFFIFWSRSRNRNQLKPVPK